MTLLLLWLREGPWERSWPSEEDLELPELLWDFSKGIICRSERRPDPTNELHYSSLMLFFLLHGGKYMEFNYRRQKMIRLFISIVAARVSMATD